MTERKLNLITGAIAGAVILVVVVLFISILIPESKRPASGRKYVAFFDDAGGIEAGDAVRIKGRRAGIVTAVEIVIRDNKPVNRVEFLIAPGTGSKWLEEERIATDSRIEVTVARMFRRPQLVITPGDEPGEIPEGGEWTNTKGRDSDSDVVKIKAMIEQVSDAVAGLNAFLDEPGGMQKVLDSIAEIRRSLEEVDERATSMLGDTSGSSEQLGKVHEQLKALGDDFAASRESIGKSVSSLVDAGANADNTVASINKELSRLAASVEEFEKSSNDNRAQFEKAGLDQLGLELRKFAARLRASMAVARADPAQFGDMPNWRKSRRYFNGDHPLPGGDPDAGKGD
jgi:ABC-type transporter Mla subunit MlaD